MKTLQSFFSRIFNKKSAGNTNTAPPKYGDQYSFTETMAMLERIFRQSGWQYERDNDENLVVKYQGESFLIEVAKDGCHCRIWDLHWYVVPLDNLANFALVRKAINECNVKSAITFFYGTNDEEQEMYVHTKIDINWIPLISDFKYYLQSIFDVLLGAHHHFYREMEILRQEEYAKQNP